MGSEMCIRDSNRHNSKCIDKQNVNVNGKDNRIQLEAEGFMSFLYKYSLLFDGSAISDKDKEVKEGEH